MLTRSCFVLALCFSAVDLVSARTLIFQSQSETTPKQPEVEARLTTTSNSVSSQSAPVVYSTGNTSSANSELFFMIEQLQTEVRELRGLVEEQSNEIRQLQQEGKSRYQDLDSRMLELTKKVSVAPAPVAPSISEETSAPNRSADGLGATSLGVIGPEKANGEPVGDAKPQAKVAPEPTEEQKMEYQQAYGLIKEKSFDEAIDRLHKFIEHYPEGELAGNAYYWLGEVYMALPKLEQARQAFTVVVGSFPDHRKVADALFKLGVVYDRLQDPRQSEKYLTEVQTKFPESTAAKLAKSYRINR